MSDADLAIFSQ